MQSKQIELYCYQYQIIELALDQNTNNEHSDTEQWIFNEQKHYVRMLDTVTA